MTSSTRLPLRRDLDAQSRWRHPFNILQTNLQEIDADMDVDAAVEAVIDAGADTWMLNAGGIVSFYPTDLPFQTRDPHLDRRASGDLFGDAVQAAKRRGVRVIARLDMSKVSARIAEGNPEWLFRTADGEPQVYGDLYSTCPSGEYYQARLFDVVDEVLDRYGADGVFFNWFNFNERSYDGVLYGACHCAACVRGFAAFSGGAEIPTGDPRSDAYRSWRAYTSQALAELTVRITDHVAVRGEDVGAILRDAAPIVYAEANNAYRSMPGKDFWPYATGQSVSAHRSARPDAAVLVNAVAFLEFGYRMGAEQPEHFGQYVAQAVARGGNPSLFHFGEPGRLPMGATLEPGREIMRIRQEHRDVYDGMRSTARIALVQPGSGSAVHGSRGEPIEEFRGVYEALVEAHLPFDVVPVDALTAVLERDAYDLLILPDVGRLGAVAASVDAYVDAGGRVLLTAAAGLDSAGRVELSSSPMADAGAVVTGKDIWSTYVTDAEQPDAERDRYRGPMIPVTGRRHAAVWKDAVVTRGHLLAPAPYAPPERAYGHRVSGEAAHARMAYGAGAVVSIPWTIGASYRDFGKSSTRDHLISVVDSLIERTVTTDLPEAVEIVLAGNGRDTIVHLINHSGARRRSYRQTIPVRGATLRLIGRGREAVTVDALGDGRALAATTERDDLVIELPELELFDVIRIASGDARDDARDDARNNAGDKEQRRGQ